MVEINLLPQKYRKQNEPSAWRFGTYALIPLTVAAILIPEVVTQTRIGDLSRQIDALNGEVTALTPAKREYDALKQEQSALEQVTNVATQLRSGKTYWTNDLAAFTAQLPTGGGVSIKTMSIRSVDAAGLSTLQQSGAYAGKAVTREIDLSGVATSQQAVVNFLRTFENNPGFGVNFKSLQTEGDTNRYTFSASVGVVGTPPAGAAGSAAPGTSAPGTSAPGTSTPGTPAPSTPAPTAPPAGGTVGNVPGAPEGPEGPEGGAGRVN